MHSQLYYDALRALFRSLWQSLTSLLKPDPPSLHSLTQSAVEVPFDTFAPSDDVTDPLTLDRAPADTGGFVDPSSLSMMTHRIA